MTSICLTLCLSLVASAAPNKKAPARAAPQIAEPVPAPAPAPPPEPMPAAAQPAAPKTETAPAPASGPASSTARPRLMVLELSASAGVDREIASSLSEAIAIEAGRIGAFEVMTQKDLSTLLGMERQKQLLGCGEESSSCAMELAEAVGSRFVLTGSLVRLGNTWQLNMQTVDSTRAAPLGRATRLASELDTLRAQLPWALAEATATPAPKEPSRALPYGLMIGGGVALVSSAALFLVSFTTEQTAVAELNVMGATLNHNAEYYRLQGEQIAAMRLGGAIAAGVGAAALLVGILINPRSDAVTRVALVPTFSGAALAGSFP